MSTSYIPLKDVLVSDLFDGRLEQFKIHESRSEETTETDRCMTDGENYVWVNVDANGCVVEFVRYGSNSPRKILNTVGDLFQTEIISQHEPQYHGFILRRNGMRISKVLINNRTTNSTSKI